MLSPERPRGVSGQARPAAGAGAKGGGGRRRELGDRIYPAARLSIRERTLLLLEPYLERILKSIIAHGAQPMMELPLLTVFLAHGIGSVILHQPSEWMESCGQELQDTVCRLLGLTEASVREMHRLSGFNPARFPLEEA